MTLKLRFGGSLVEQLGAQLYPSATATVAELVSNAWDADARNVWVQVPFGEEWTEDSEIVVTDDGHGMTATEAQEKYLVVGYKRRLSKLKDRSPSGRKVHGRKGIGKLAAFGTARILECTTRKGTETTSFSLDYDEIRKLSPDQDYEVEGLDDGPLTVPASDSLLEHGCRIRLTRLWLKRALSQDQFMQSMSRRFSLDQTKMTVHVNGVRLSRFDIPVQFRFPRDGVPAVEPPITIDDEGWACETVDDRPVRWWTGFTKEPIADESLQGISILARGKMAQRPFKFERAGGTWGQLGQEYLVGEVEADWIDEGLDIEDDLIQSNRDQLLVEDRRLDPLLEWGRKRLGWALRRRSELRQIAVEQTVEALDGVKELLRDLTPREQGKYMQVARTLSQVEEIQPNDIAGVMDQLMAAREDRVVRELMEQIQDEAPDVQSRMWDLVRQFGLIDARRVKSIVEARLKAVGRLKSAVAGGAREVPEIHSIILSDVWLLDPRWHLLDEEVDLAALGVNYAPALDEQGKQVDFLFVLSPRPPAPADEVVVVEIKRGTNADGSTRSANEKEIDKFSGYVTVVQDCYSRSTDRPTVQGLMIAQTYTPNADLKRKMLEKLQDPRLRFKTWDRVLDETQRMHLSWLDVSRRRAAAPASLPPSADAGASA